IGRHSFRISVDKESIRVIGSDRFEVASRYDVIAIPIHAIRPSTAEARETILLIEPDAGVKGPVIRLRLRVALPPGRIAATIGATTMGLLLVGLPGLLEVATPVKVALLAVGGITAASAAVLGLRRPT